MRVVLTDHPSGQAPWVDMLDEVTLRVERELVAHRERHPEATIHEMGLEYISRLILAVGGNWEHVGPQFRPEYGGAPPELPPLFGVDREGAIEARRQLVLNLATDHVTKLDAALPKRELAEAERGKSDGQSEH